MACRSLFVVPFVLELSGRVLSYSDKLWGLGEYGGGGGDGGGAWGQKGRRGLCWRDWELGGGSPSPLPAIVSASSVVSPKSPLPALRASPLLLLLLLLNSTLFHRPTGYTAAPTSPPPLLSFPSLPRFHCPLSKPVSFSLSTSFTLPASQPARGTSWTFKYQSICASRLIELPLMPRRWLVFSKRKREFLGGRERVGIYAATSRRHCFSLHIVPLLPPSFYPHGRETHISSPSSSSFSEDA